MADDFIESILDLSCQIAKHKKSDSLSVNDVIYAMGNFYIFLFFISN